MSVFLVWGNILGVQTATIITVAFIVDLIIITKTRDIVIDHVTLMLLKFSTL